MRFLNEIIDDVRSKCGADFPLIVRLTVDEMYDRIGQKGRGYGLDEGIKMAKMLNEKGIDAIDVSSGAYDTFNYWLEPTTFECGWRKNLAAEVKRWLIFPLLRQILSALLSRLSSSLKTESRILFHLAGRISQTRIGRRRCKAGMKIW